MSTKQKIRLILFLSLLVTITVLSTCYGGFRSLCGPGVNESFAVFLILFGSAVFVLSFILLFVHEQKFYSWLRFSKYYLPIAAGIIFLSPAVDSSILGFDKEFMTWLLAGIFFITSLGIIIFKRQK
ncbi:MAG: hypothetical protein A3J55_03115 [Candidatus Ryanbacteria bacterium RIFCSPHIGHO2_02_FULL_45_17b]|uniref:EamA domain-containing protein n=1 Tax=Candidatus Ryanbacteria bacterium RIFCSPHIGHO2_01_FULL_45_22 TaxID=1802114 RepID=A0A1G2FXM7_9BACT|nr:MAG: hypothetical protein A2719_00090 [Candidatus Ryanbacteria bacterium RIFCSPHIGHO2_01_FULL_45_22]OGZ46538.1 MAG: hypothetical protein A3J55_03115 [Candidatus Ryanbacteria bacterium RIFCSPHIGHO2_02_FULL_45_17b]